MRLVDDLGRYRPEECLFDRAVASGTEDHEVSADLFGDIDDDRCRPSRDQPGRDLDAGTPQARDSPLEQGFAVDPQAVADVIAGNVGDAGIPLAAVPRCLSREDRQDLQMRARWPGQGGRCLESKRQFEEPSIASKPSSETPLPDG